MDEATDLVERLLVVATSVLEDAASQVILQSERKLGERVDLVSRGSSELALLAATAPLILMRLS